MSEQSDMQQKGAIVWMVFILALALAFIVLKLLVVITWSWWWVVSPIWIPMALGVILSVCGVKPPQ